MGIAALVCALLMIRAVWRGEMRTRFCQNYFLGIGFGKTETCISRPQKGVWGMNAGGFRNFFRALILKE